MILNIVTLGYYFINVARGFAAQKSLRENIPWFFIYSQFNIFSV